MSSVHCNLTRMGPAPPHSILRPMAFGGVRVASLSPALIPSPGLCAYLSLVATLPRLLLCPGHILPHSSTQCLSQSPAGRCLHHLAPSAEEPPSAGPVWALWGFRDKCTLAPAGWCQQIHRGSFYSLCPQVSPDELVLFPTEPFHLTVDQVPLGLPDLVYLPTVYMEVTVSVPG